MPAPQHGGARALLHDSTSERLAEKAPGGRMAVYTTGGFQMPNSRAGNSLGTAAQRCEA